MARVSEGCATLHSSAARVKFSVRATARKYRTWCISIRASPRASSACLRTRFDTRRLTHIVQLMGVESSDQPTASLERDVAPCPVQRDDEAVAKSDQEIDVGDAPQHPGEETRDVQSAKLRHGPRAADCGQQSVIAVAEWPERLALAACD